MVPQIKLFLLVTSLNTGLYLEETQYQYLFKSQNYLPGVFLYSFFFLISPTLSSDSSLYNVNQHDLTCSFLFLSLFIYPRLYKCLNHKWCFLP